MHGAVQEITYGHVPSNDLGTRLDEDLIKSYETMFSTSYINRSVNALLGPRVNPLMGSPNVKLRKVGTKGTLTASNSRKG